MKSILTLLIMCLTALTGFSQKTFKEEPADSVHLVKAKSIYGNTQYEVSRNLVISNEEKTTGVSLNIRMTSKLELKAISGTILNIGKGYAGEELILYFKNGAKLYFSNSLAALPDGGEVAFYIPDRMEGQKEYYLNLLRTQPVVKIKIAWKKGVTEKLTGNDQRYFIQLMYAADHGLYRKQ